MLSKGKQIEYSCPYCKDTDITKEYIPKTFAALLPEDDIRYNNDWFETTNYGHCNSCDQWFAWKYRHKKSLKSGKVSTRTGRRTSSALVSLQFVKTGDNSVYVDIER